MLIVLVTSGLPCTGNSLETGSLGGSETALISVARALRKRGHEVRVYCECPSPGVYDGVQYYDKSQFIEHNSLAAIDVLIASRWFHFLAAPIAAGLRVMWLHDILVGHEEFMGGQYQTDLVMPLSDFHIENYCEKLPHLRSLMWKTANGVDVDLVQKCIKPKVPGKLIYTSRPERGLHFLLKDILPKIVAKRPDVKLYYANYDTSALGAPPQVKQIVEMCDGMAKANPQHVVPMGHLTKEALYQQMSSAQLQLFPTDFPEIFCISAIEAQACGTPFVSTNDFALRETVGADSGVLVDGHPTDEDYANRFANKVLDLLDDQERLSAMSAAGMPFVKSSGFTWDAVAESWESKFQQLVKDRQQSNPGAIVKQLVRENDLMVAEFASRKFGLQDWQVRIGELRRQAISESPEESEVVADFQAAMPRFTRLNQLLQSTGVANAGRVLDYGCTDVCYGLVLAKAAPDIAVTVLAKSEVIADRLRVYAERSSLQNVTVLGPSQRVLEHADEQFDVVFLGDVIDTRMDPIDALTGLQNKYLKKNGLLIGTTRFGTRGTSSDGDIDRLWNLDFSDYRLMFGKCPRFTATFVEEGVSPRGDLFGHWCWAFQKSVQLDRPDVAGKIDRTRPYQSLAVCMIAKNEENTIGGCLASVQHIADKIVVVDTGSTDETASIAAKYGAEVRHVEFDNFAQARNASIEAVDSDWILWIDADERLAGSDKLRRYLNTQLFNGFGVRQNHLMLDIGKSFDVPIRLLRNREYHRFTGLIHEHCEKVDVKPYDDPIAPVLVLPDVDIVHYGYLNERVRRQKCSNRNMELLIRDVQESAPKGRMLTWVLVIRDYLNFVKWHLERTQGRVLAGSFQHELLCAAVTTYKHYFGDGTHRYACIAEPMYQEALSYLGRNGLCYHGRQLPPFEVALALTGAYGGLENSNVAPQTRWFLDHAEFMIFLHGRGVALSTALNVPSSALPKLSDNVTTAVDSPLPDAVKLLSSGLNVIPHRVA